MRLSAHSRSRSGQCVLSRNKCVFTQSGSCRYRERRGELPRRTGHQIAQDPTVVFAKPEAS